MNSDTRMYTTWVVLAAIGGLWWLVSAINNTKQRQTVKDVAHERVMCALQLEEKTKTLTDAQINEIRDELCRLAGMSIGCRLSKEDTKVLAYMYVEDQINKCVKERMSNQVNRSGNGLSN